jgi:NAD(P)-dependent dehydrogenase (short-subunit alcohol dehydrogenase family)
MPTVLVTGAARGIGRTTSLHLARRGWDVVAGVRGEADGAALAAEPDAGGRVTAITLDVTSGADVAALPGWLPDRLDAVVNNAGIALGGPVEALPLDEWRRQFEVNLFGQVAVTQAVLPKLRTSRGRVVFVSSLSGVISTPLTGAYSASKFALEAMADALRMEVRPWGVRVALIEPGSIDTDIWRYADAVLDETVASLSPEHRELYAGHIEGFRKMIPLSQKFALPAEGVAAAIERALTARRPRSRYVVGAGPKAQNVMARTAPTRLRDAALSKLLGVPRRV